MSLSTHFGLCSYEYNTSGVQFIVLHVQQLPQRLTLSYCSKRKVRAKLCASEMLEHCDLLNEGYNTSMKDTQTQLKKNNS